MAFEGVGSALRERGMCLWGAVLAAGLGLLVAGCSTRGHSLPYGGANLDKPDPVTPEEQVYDIPLGPLDVVHVQVFRVPDLSADYQVDARGMLDLPLLGAVSVRDQRPDAFAQELRRLYGARYLNNPDITVRVVTTNGANVTVEGGVSQSGIYPLPGRTTLLGAIALAHGLDQNVANRRRVAIFRKQGGRTVAAAFDLQSIHEGKMADPLVYPGDTIVVDSDNLRQSYRDLLTAIPTVALFGNL